MKKEEVPPCVLYFLLKCPLVPPTTSLQEHDDPELNEEVPPFISPFLLYTSSKFPFDLPLCFFSSPPSSLQVELDVLQAREDAMAKNALVSSFLLLTR